MQDSGNFASPRLAYSINLRITFFGVAYQYKVVFPDFIGARRRLGRPDSMCSRRTPEIANNRGAQQERQESPSLLVHVVLLLAHD
jgi:hypothetical protein